MRACVMLEPQAGMSYDRILEIAQLALSLGLDGTFRSDHYSSAGEAPVTDAWATLAGLVRDIDRGVVGTLVSPVGFRHAGNLAKVVATVAHMSRGPRVEVGIGTGWNQAEHDGYGFAFPPIGSRFAELEKNLQFMRAVIAGTTPSGYMSRPRADVRIICGGGGLQRTPRLAARYADELNVVMLPPDEARKRYDACRRFASESGREVTFSWMGGFLVGRTHAELMRRAERTAAAHNTTAHALIEHLRPNAIVGTLAEAADRVGQLAEAGASRIMLQHMSDDDDHLAVAVDAVNAA